MNVENTFDEVIFAALQAGLVPDGSDLEQVRVPAGEDPTSFRQSLTRTAERIAALRRQGNHGEAREIAATAQGEYLASFQALLPIPAGGTADPEPEITDLGDLGSRMFGR